MRAALPLRLAVVCLITTACAHETRERPVQSTPRPPAAISSVPLPETAFRSDEELRAPRSAQPPERARSPLSRFETRRIGEPDEGAVSPSSASGRYRGRTVDLDLKSADLVNVFRLLAEVGHVNIVVVGEMSGTVTMRLRHVPWDQALDVIARAKGLVLERDGNIILVRTRA